MQTDIQLKIRNHFKAIPYPPVQRDSERTSSYGFKNIKGRPADAESIPELKYNEALKRAVLAISESRTPFFTIGCESSLNHDAGVFWLRGYIEFAFNYAALVSDAQNYFKLFFDFNFHVFETNLDLPVQFSWELDGAIFLDATQSQGFTLAVWITTRDLTDEAETLNAWNKAVMFLADFLQSQPLIPMPMIYRPPTA